jgi:hypothetical protein
MNSIATNIRISSNNVDINYVDNTFANQFTRILTTYVDDQGHNQQEYKTKM